jgi:hypothetical protein
LTDLNSRFQNCSTLNIEWGNTLSPMEIINQIDRENKQLALEGKFDAIIQNNKKAETELRLYESCIRKVREKAGFEAM